MLTDKYKMSSLSCDFKLLDAREKFRKLASLLPIYLSLSIPPLSLALSLSLSLHTNIICCMVISLSQPPSFSTFLCQSYLLLTPQGAFVITACGFDCTLRPLPFEAPSPDMAARMCLKASGGFEGD